MEFAGEAKGGGGGGGAAAGEGGLGAKYDFTKWDPEEAEDWVKACAKLPDDVRAHILDAGMDGDILNKLDALMALEEYTPLDEGLAAALPAAVKKAKVTAELVESMRREHRIDSVQRYIYCLKPGRAWEEGKSLKEQARLGAGAFGELFLMRNPYDDQLYAVKLVDMDGTQRQLYPKATMDEVREKVYQETKNLAKIHHPRVVQYYTSFEFVDEDAEGRKSSLMAIVCEYLEGGDLEELLPTFQDAATGKPDEARIKETMRQIMDALASLHAMDPAMIHRDLKSSNILVSRDGLANISDLALGTTLKKASDDDDDDDDDDAGDGQYRNEGQGQGDVTYRSTEMFEGEDYGTATDIWSSGCILLELVLGKTIKSCLGRRNPFAMVIGAKFREKLLKLAEERSATLGGLCRRMLNPFDEQRPSAADILEELGGAGDGAGGGARVAELEAEVAEERAAKEAERAAKEAALAAAEAARAARKAAEAALTAEQAKCAALEEQLRKKVAEEEEKKQKEELGVANPPLLGFTLFANVCMRWWLLCARTRAGTNVWIRSLEQVVWSTKNPGYSGAEILNGRTDDHCPMLADPACNGIQTYKVRVVAGSTNISLGAALASADRKVIGCENTKFWKINMYNRTIYEGGKELNRSSGPSSFSPPYTADVTINTHTGTIALAVSGTDYGVVVSSLPKGSKAIHFAVGTNHTSAQVTLM